MCIKQNYITYSPNANHKQREGLHKMWLTFRASFKPALNLGRK